MANPDDMKVGVLADLADIEQQGVRAGEAFQKGFSKGAGFGPGGIGGAILGNGMAPTQGPSQAPGDSVAGILEKILQSLDTGFGRLLEAAGGGLGGGAATSPTGTFFKGQYDYEADKAQAQARQQQQSQGGGGGGFNMGGVLGAANMFPQQSYANMYNSGFYSTNVAQFAASATSSIPILGQFLGVVSNTMQQRDSALRDLLGVFRGGGKNAWGILHNEMTGDGSAGPSSLGGVEMMKQFGVDRSEAVQLMMMASRAGQSSNFEDLVPLQGLYGMGQQGAGLMGTLNRGGGNQLGSTQTLFANVLATAIGQQLDRGRWGEAFESISKAAGRIQTGNVDTQGVFGMMNFIGTMGSRFKGDTQASSEMVGMLQGMQGGQGGAFGNLAALQAAGLGQPGVSFTDAWMRVQRGAAEGGVGLRDVLKQYERLPVVQRYLASGGEGDLNTAVFVLSRLLPQYKPTDIEALLRSMRTSGYQTGEAFGTRPGTVAAMKNALRFGTIPEKERDLIGGEINDRMQWSEAAIGSANQDFTSADNPGGLPETMQDLERGGALRSGPSVQMIDAPVDQGPIGGAGMEGYGEQRSYWPMGPGDKQESGYKPGWRKVRSSDPFGGRHMARDIIIGSGRAGERVYSPVDGVWLTNTPAPSNPRNSNEGYVALMLGDNGYRYKFVELVFDGSLRKGSRIRQGQFIGTTATGAGGNSVPQLHLEAWGRGKGGKPTPIDPYTTFDATARDIMRGAQQGPGGDAGPAPEFLDTDKKGNMVPANPDTYLRDIPSGSTSMNGVDVNIYVYDGRVSVQKSASRTKKAGDPNRLYGGTKVG